MKSKRILITGGGGAAAISLLKSYKKHDYTLFVADIDPMAAGLYLVPASNRLIIPRGDDPSFIGQMKELAKRHAIDVFIPTVDSELFESADHRADFEKNGTSVMVAPADALATCLDKYLLMQEAEDIIPVPKTAVLDESFSLDGWSLPLIAKPRSGSGSRGIVLVKSADQLDHISLKGDYIVQEFLPGEEYSVDTLCDMDGKVLAAVPRERMKIDSGIAVAAKTVKHPELIDYASKIAEHLGLTFTSNVQFRFSSDGVPKLLEINARFPGTMPLTVSAGIDMPLLSMKMIEGEVFKKEDLDFSEIAVVRFLEEKNIELSEMEDLIDLAKKSNSKNAA